ncbi:hypothetical protein DFJ74DRAFT_705714 [Hyaloraphidium curvatum]|nr:hypothetical protein DFJ74DRAFT_705714 [Hyaloraphidium curvatum]
MAASEGSAALPPAWEPAGGDTLTLYFDQGSQPSRAVYQLIIEGNVPAKLVRIDLRKREQKTPAFLSINKEGLVPVINHGGKYMPESADILRYVSQTFPSAALFYAALDADKRAQVDDALKWSGDELRPVTTGLTREVALYRRADKAAELRAKIPAVVDALEARLRAARPAGKPEGETGYLCGTDSPTIADIQVLHEVNGPQDMGLLDVDDGKHPLASQWLKVMAARPASVTAYGNFGWIMWAVKNVLYVKSLFGSKTGVL